VVEDTTYTSVYWKNHAMYFLPLTQRAGVASDPDNTIEKDQSMFAGAMVIQTSRPIPGFEKIVAIPGRHQPQPTIVKFQTFQQQIDDRFIEERLIARLTSLFGLLALCSPPSASTASPLTPSSAARRRSASAWPLAPNAPRHRHGHARRYVAGVPRPHYWCAHLDALRPLCQGAALQPRPGLAY
jgi:hypothetical protein